MPGRRVCLERAMAARQGSRAVTGACRLFVPTMTTKG